MRQVQGTRITRLLTVLVVVGCLAGIGASAASARNEVFHFTYNDNDGSAWGNVKCHGRIIYNKKYPSDGPNEGGKETEKCVSTEPGGKLTGFFEPSEIYTGYWESDYYHFGAAENTQKFPSSLTIKVAANFESYKVTAIYPPGGNPPVEEG
jgi:hypothetical protein